MQTVHMDPDERRAWLEGYGLGASFLDGWPPDSIQAQLYRAATLAAPHDDAVDRLLDAHCRAHGEPAEIAQLERCDPRDSRVPSGPGLSIPYFQLHRAWMTPGVRPWTRARLAQVLLLVASGASTRSMAVALGVSQTTVRRDLRRLGLSPRSVARG